MTRQKPSKSKKTTIETRGYWLLILDSWAEVSVHHCLTLSQKGKKIIKKEKILAIPTITTHHQYHMKSVYM